MFFSTSYLIYVFGSLRAAKVIHSTLMSSVLGTTLRYASPTKLDYFDANNRVDGLT